MVKMSGKIGVVGALGLMLSLVLAACGGEEPTATPRPAATPTPEAMAAEPTPTAMMAEEATPTPLPEGVTAAPAVPTPTARPTATPLPVDPGFDAEAHFKGRTISLLVGFNPGGGTDAQARFMSRAWSKFIPGNPRIIVRNLTPVVVERNFVWNAKPDGLTLAIEATPGVFDQFTPQAQFDMREATMIGVTSGKEGLWVIRGTVPYNCIDSAFGSTEPKLTVGTSAPTPADLGSMVAVGWLADKLNVPFEIRNVSAAGSAEQYVMIERGDVNSWVTGTIWDQYPRTRPGWTGSGFIRPFADLSFPGFDLGHNGEADFHCPNVADEYLEGDDLALWVAMRGPQIYASKNIIGPPGVPSDVVATLRKALADAMADEGFATEMQSFTGIKNTFTHGDVAQQELTDTVNAFIDNQDRIGEVTQLVFDKYVR
jgi:tripartite-type tricarboxylate transporter receptor subunit TctC